MKKNKNYLWLTLGIITIVFGLVLPFTLMNQSVYFESEVVNTDVNRAYNITITSKKEISDLKSIVIKFNCSDQYTRKYELYSFKSNKNKGKYIYEFQCVVNDSLIDDVTEVEVYTDNDSFYVNEKLHASAKISISAFVCVIGGFMIFLQFYNTSTKNRAQEVKQLVGESAPNNNQPANIEDLFKEENQNTSEIKKCEYCGTFAGPDEKVCSSCGAQLKNRK